MKSQQKKQQPKDEKRSKSKAAILVIQITADLEILLVEDKLGRCFMREVLR
jgi:hypothetical protein